jgi:hypothetical protein
MTKLVDYKKREIKIGERVRIEKDIPSVDGMLHKNTIVKIDEHNKIENTIRVVDTLGKIWWIDPNDVSASFL